MPTVQCPGCGKAVKFEGVAGVCPSCASIVRAPRAAGGTAGKAAPREGATGGRRPTAGAQLSDLEAVGGEEGEEVFNPDAGGTYDGSGRRGGPFGGLDKNIVYAIAGGVGLILIFALYVILKPSHVDPSLTQATPAPTYVPTKPTAPTDEEAKPDKAPVLPITNPDPVVQLDPVVNPVWVGLKPRKPVLPIPPITDAAVEKSLILGSKFLKAQYKDGQAPDNGDPHEYGAANALCTYALLHVGEAIEDSDLQSNSEFMQKAIEADKRMNLSGGFETYGRGLQAMMLGLFNRDKDRDQLAKDRDWLLKAETKGAYGYFLPPAGTAPDQVSWDNSNSQYGVLGIWAASEAGTPAPDTYWKDVDQHWISCQREDGGWGYTGGGSSITMTSAGVTTLCVAAEQQTLIARKGDKSTQHQKFSAAIEKGINWLGTGDNLLSVNADDGYTVYGIERAALATGYRYFGTHDWYRDIGARVITQQEKDGHWPTAYSDSVGASFHLLFLARGRQPLLMDKLRFDGDWNDRPRDVAKLTSFASSQLEKPFAWGVADLNRAWQDWLEAPVLLITTDAPVPFTDEQCAKLRAYADAGGFILFHAEFGDKGVAASGRDLAHRLYPEYPLAKVAPGDPIYSALFPINAAKAKPEVGLEVVSNGSRPLMVIAPNDLTKDWVQWRSKDGNKNVNLQVGLNLFVAAAGKVDFRNRLNSPYLGKSEVAAIGTVPIQLIKYDGGNAMPEPIAWQRFANFFQNETSIGLDPQVTDIKAVDRNHGPIAVLTGNADVDFSKMDLHALQEFVSTGGVLIVDAAGGNKAFAKAVHDSLLPAAFPGGTPSDLPVDHPLLAGRLACSDLLPRPKVRRFSSELLKGSPPAPMQYMTVNGRGTVLISDLDLTTGLLAASTYAVDGYTPAYANSLAKNVVLWTLDRYTKVATTRPTTAPATPAAVPDAAPAQP